MRDSLYDSTITRLALPFVVRTANATVNGATIDKSYQNNMFRVVMFSIATGTLTDGDTTIGMEDSDNGSVWAAVNSSYIQGALPAIASTDDDKTFDIGYTGPKRFVRLTATQANATSGGTMGAVAILAQARRTPVRH